MSDPTLSAQATRAAILAASLRTRLDKGPSSADGLSLDPDPWRIPDLTTVGFTTATKGADCIVSFHEEPRKRTVYVYIDPTVTITSADDYVLELDTTSSTYTVPGSPPADYAALLTAIAAAWQTTHSAVATITTTRIAPGTGADDGIKIQAVNTDPTTYADFSVGASTSAPETAAMVILREPTSASLRIWTRTGAETGAAAVFGGPASRQWQAPRLARDVGALPTHGYDQRLDIAERRMVHLELYDVVDPDETISIATSGAGVYGLQWLALAVVAGQVEP